MPILFNFQTYVKFVSPRCGKTKAIGCCISAWLLLTTACGTNNKDNKCSIIVANQLSGIHSDLGREIQRALAIVKDEMKEKNLKGIEIREIDTESTPSVARAQIERAITRWNPKIIVGSILSSETREFLPSVLARGITVIANGSSDPGIRILSYRKARDGFFRNWPADDFEGKVMAEYIISSNRAKDVVVLYANDSYAKALAKAFSDRFMELGGKVINSTAYPKDLTNFFDVLKAIKVNEAEGIYMVGFPPDLAAIYDTVRTRFSKNEKSIPIYSAVGINTGEFTGLVQVKLDNLIFTTPAVDESSGAYFKFNKQYQAKYKGEEPGIVAAIAYDALTLSIDAVINAGCDAQKIASYLYARPAYAGVSGPTAFDDLGDVVTKGININYYEKGRKLLGETFYAAKSKQ